jgi:predicted RNA polymerase sigma factor
MDRAGQADPGQQPDSVRGAAARYHHLPSVRGDLLAKLGRRNEAATEFRRAASLTKNIPERTVLLRRAAWCSTPSQQTPA